MTRLARFLADAADTWRQCGQPHGLQYVGACLACGNARAARPAPVTAAPTEGDR